MFDNFTISKDKIQRRELLKMGLFGAGVATTAGIWQFLKTTNNHTVKVPPLEMSHSHGAANPTQVLRNFEYGTIKRENGRIIREFQLVAGTSQIQLNSAVSYNIWDLNGRIPGPTLRAKQGEK